MALALLTNAVTIYQDENIRKFATEIISVWKMYLAINEHKARQKGAIEAPTLPLPTTKPKKEPDMDLAYGKLPFGDDPFAPPSVLEKLQLMAKSTIDTLPEAFALLNSNKDLQASLLYSVHLIGANFAALIAAFGTSGAASSEFISALGFVAKFIPADKTLNLTRLLPMIRKDLQASAPEAVKHMEQPLYLPAPQMTPPMSAPHSPELAHIPTIFDRHAPVEVLPQDLNGHGRRSSVAPSDITKASSRRSSRPHSEAGTVRTDATRSSRHSSSTSRSHRSHRPEESSGHRPSRPASTHDDRRSVTSSSTHTRRPSASEASRHRHRNHSPSSRRTDRRLPTIIDEPEPAPSRVSTRPSRESKEPREARESKEKKPKDKKEDKKDKKKGEKDSSKKKSRVGTVLKQFF